MHQFTQVFQSKDLLKVLHCVLGLGFSHYPCVELQVIVHWDAYNKVKPFKVRTTLAVEGLQVLQCCFKPHPKHVQCSQRNHVLQLKVALLQPSNSFISTEFSLTPKGALLHQTFLIISVPSLVQCTTAWKRDLIETVQGKCVGN